MNTVRGMHPSVSARPSLQGLIADDILGFWKEQGPDYRRIAEVWKLSKQDLSKLGEVKLSSVRFDDKIPERMAERLSELANIANLVAEFFGGNVHKVGLWFQMTNPFLGNMSPRDMIRAGRYKRLLNYVLEARAAEQEAAKARELVESSSGEEEDEEERDASAFASRA